MTSETYLNHPTFGLLYKICSLEENQELFTTLYAQRLFFLVTFVGTRFSFESISRSEARLMVEQRMRKLRRAGAMEEYQTLQGIHKRI